MTCTKIMNLSLRRPESIKFEAKGTELDFESEPSAVEETLSNSLINGIVDVPIANGEDYTASESPEQQLTGKTM